MNTDCSRRTRATPSAISTASGAPTRRVPRPPTRCPALPQGPGQGGEALPHGPPADGEPQWPDRRRLGDPGHRHRWYQAAASLARLWDSRGSAPEGRLWPASLDPEVMLSAVASSTVWEHRAEGIPMRRPLFVPARDARKVEVFGADIYLTMPRAAGGRSAAGLLFLRRRESGWVSAVASYFRHPVMLASLGVVLIAPWACSVHASLGSAPLPRPTPRSRPSPQTSAGCRRL